jgi:hypothetical protein
MNTNIHALSGSEPTIPAFERTKTVHASDGATTVIARKFVFNKNYLVSHSSDYKEYYYLKCDMI